MLAKPLTKPLYNPLTRLSEGFTTLASLVKLLFAAGEQGWWYDPSDLSTLYQDAAGTTPVTAMEQFVGLILDKSKGLVLGPELVTNGDFSQGTAGWTANAPSFVKFNGVVNEKAELEIIGLASGNAGIDRAISTTAGKWYKASCYVEATNTNGAFITIVSVAGALGNKVYGSGTSSVIFKATGPTETVRAAVSLDNEQIGEKYYFDNISVRELPGNHGYQTTPTKRMKVSRRVNKLVGTAALATQNTPTVAGAHTLKFTGAGSVTLSGTATGAYAAGTHAITCTAGTLTLTVAGAVNDADFRLSIDNHLPFQWVNTATDYDDDPAKFPTYLQGDGIDDCFVTNNIDLTGTDKVNVWAGVTKLSDAATAILVEFSDNVNLNTGAFYITAPEVVYGSAQRFRSKGTIGDSGPISQLLPAPVSMAITGEGGIAADIQRITVNGVATASGIDQGAGNYGNHSLFIGARDQTSLFFSGRIYPMLGRGALSNASQHAAVNQYIKQRMMLP